MFESFFIAGFECATGRNRHREPLDQIRATRHDALVDEDYARLQALGIGAVREAIRWPRVDHAGRYDFSSVEPFLRAAQAHGLQVIWDLFHYGYPDDLDPFDPRFAERFAAYCDACARYVRARTEGTCWFTPVNEPSYFAWAAGEAALFAPHRTGQAGALKRALIGAAIRGIDAIHAVDPSARIVNADPVCWVSAPPDRPELVGEAERFNHTAVFESWDMLSGTLYPELGGSPRHLDIVGINYYWTNQWEVGRPGTPLSDEDPRKRSLEELVCTVWERYGHEMIVSETAHAGDARPSWILTVARAARTLLASRGVPLRAVCLYPAISMPEWHAQDEWAPLGLWDIDPEDPARRRKPHVRSLRALRAAQAVMASVTQKRALVAPSSVALARGPR